MPLKINCEQCGEELDTISVYLEHLRKHKSKQHESESWTIEGLYRGFKRLMEKAVLGLVLLLGALLLAVLFFEFRKNQPIVTPFDVPSELKEFTGVTIAELLIDEINNRLVSAQSAGYSQLMGADIGLGVQTTRPEPVRFKRASAEVLTIKMEVGGISLDSLVSYVKGIFGKETEVISGDVIKNGDTIKIIARTNKKGPWEEEGKENGLETVIDRLAEQMAFEMAPDYMKPTELARFYSNNGKYEEADMVYRKITKESPNRAEAYIYWASVLLNLRQDDDAMRKYEKAYEIACANSNANKTPCADVLIDWAIGLSIMSNDATLMGNQEDAAKYEFYKQEAFKKYEEAAKIAPQNPEVYSQWGYELALEARRERDSGNSEEAGRKYSDAISKFVGFNRKPNADFYNYWGSVHAMMGDYELSIENRNKAVETDPEYYLAYYYWGLDLYYWARIYDNMGDFDEATKKYRKSVSKYRQSLYINPKYSDTYYRLGVSLETLGMNEEGIKQFEKAIQLDPKHPYAHNDLGYALERLGKYNVAIEEYKEAIRLNPTYPPPYEGWVKSLEAISKDKTDDGEVKKELAKAYYGWGWALSEVCRRNQPVEKCNKDKVIVEKYKKAKELGGRFLKSGSDGNIGESSP
ncbi:MAG: tetratricopeptide repeat protein [Deltaproteobacteria bacterium]|nr:tetratricopeptide repeat protein [Deltaproteobacteria bacterium]